MSRRALPRKFIFALTVVMVAIAMGMVIALPSLKSLTADEDAIAGYIISTVFILFPVILVAGLIIYYMRQSEIEARLIRNGIQGIAEILGREQTGTYVNNQPEIHFRLRISLPGKDAYTTDHNEVVSLLDIGAINPGVKLPVYVDPSDQNNMLLKFTSESQA